MFNPQGTYRRGPAEGEIALFCKGAIGLRSILDMIGLYPTEVQPYMKIAGLTFMLTARGLNPSDYAIGTILKASKFKVTIPGGTLPYYSEMSGWQLHETHHDGYYSYRVLTLTLSGEEGTDVCFAKLNKYLLDPGFPFWQFGTLLETNEPDSPKQRFNLYRLGINVPVEGITVPDWAEGIPSKEELLEMLKPALWSGPYHISVKLLPFLVDPDYEKYNYLSMRVNLGLAIYDTGELSCVTGLYVGDKTKSWPDNLWTGTRLKMLSGDAEGNEYVVVGNFKTDNDPPFGLPPNENLLRVYSPGPTPSSDGAKKGDLYEVRSEFVYTYKTVLFDKIEFGAGSYEAQTFNYTFEID